MSFTKTSGPLPNFAIDFGQNRVGEIYGNATSNLGGMLGNAIYQFSEKRATAAKKKAQEEDAAKFLSAQYGMDPKQAGEAVRGVGVENVLRFAALDQDRMESQVRIQDMQARTAQAQAKAQAAEREKLALYQSLEAAGRAPAPRSGPLSLMPAGGPGGTIQNPDGISANFFLRNAIARGVDPKVAVPMANTLLDAAKVNKTKDPFTPSMGQFEDGRKWRSTSPNSVQIDAVEAPKKPLEVGDESDVEINGKKVRAVYTGSGKYVDKATKLPLHVTQENPETYTRELVPNPILFGVDTQTPQDDLASLPRSTPSTAAIEHLRKNPGLAAAFDAKYGTGAAKRFLGR